MSISSHSKGHYKLVVVPLCIIYELEGTINDGFPILIIQWALQDDYDIEIIVDGHYNNENLGHYTIENLPSAPHKGTTFQQKGTTAVAG